MAPYAVAFYDAARARGATVVVSPGQDGEGVPTQAAVERSGSHDHHGEAHRTATVEEDITLPSASGSRERLLSVQGDHQRWSSSQDAWWANDRSGTRVQHAERDDRHGPPSFLRLRSMRQGWLAPWACRFDLCNNARNRQQEQLERESRGRHSAIVGALNAHAHRKLRTDPFFAQHGVARQKNASSGGQAKKSRPRVTGVGSEVSLFRSA